MNKKSFKTSRTKTSNNCGRGGGEISIQYNEAIQKYTCKSHTKDTLKCLPDTYLNPKISSIQQCTEDEKWKNKQKQSHSTRITTCKIQHNHNVKILLCNNWARWKYSTAVIFKAQNLRQFDKILIFIYFCEAMATTSTPKLENFLGGEAMGTPHHYECSATETMPLSLDSVFY